ncbi:MAG: hypothetical protein IPP77_13725 [Bacteroidetes bacterium]|nr:hypothetical protein [Bacteroidota bacterium]
MKTWIMLGSVLILIASCRPGQSWRKEQIEKKETALMNDADAGRTDTAAVNSLLKSYETYVADFPDDSVGAGYLFKAADFYRYMHRPAKSIVLYKKVYTNYTSLSKRPYALFLQGFTFENELGSLDSAKIIYESFLAAYPNHAIARDVKATLDNLGKTPEQIIEEFQSRQQQDSLPTAVNK